MRCFLRHPVSIPGRARQQVYQLEGFYEAGLFHDPALQIAVPDGNILYIDTSGSPAPAALEPGSVKVLPVKKPK